MGLGSLFSSLFKEKEADNMLIKGENGINTPPSATTAAAPEQNAISREEADAILFREEILDSRSRLCGYRFSMKSLDKRAFFSEQQLFEALQTAGIQRFAQRRIAVIPTSQAAFAWAQDALGYGESQ